MLRSRSQHSGRPAPLRGRQRRKTRAAPPGVLSPSRPRAGGAAGLRASQRVGSGLLSASSQVARDEASIRSRPPEPEILNIPKLPEVTWPALERLAATEMIASVDGPTPTVGGMLVLGKRFQGFLPGACIQFLRIAGTSVSRMYTVEGSTSRQGTSLSTYVAAGLEGPRVPPG